MRCECNTRHQSNTTTSTTTTTRGKPHHDTCHKPLNTPRQSTRGQIPSKKPWSSDNDPGMANRVAPTDRHGCTRTSPQHQSSGLRRRLRGGGGRVLRFVRGWMGNGVRGSERKQGFSSSSVRLWWELNRKDLNEGSTSCSLSTCSMSPLLKWNLMASSLA